MAGRTIQACLIACCALIFVAPRSPVRAGTPSVLRGFGEMAVDAAHGHVFVSEGLGGNDVQVYDFSGHLLKIIGGFKAPMGLALDGNLYVANATGSTIDVVDTATLATVSSYPTALDNPHDLVVLDGVIWFISGACGGWDDGMGYVVLSSGRTAIADQNQSRSLPCAQLAAPPPSSETLFSYASFNGGIQKYRIHSAVIDGVTEPSLEFVTGKNMTNEGGPVDVAVSPSGDKLLMTSQASNALVETDLDLNPVMQYSDSARGRSVGYSPDGTRLAVAHTTHHGRINLYAQGGRDDVGHISLPHPIAYRGLEYSPDGERLFVITGAYDYYGAIAPYHFEVMSSTKISADIELRVSRHHVKYGTKVALKADVDGESRSPEVRFYALRNGRELFVGKASISPAGIATLRGLPTRNSRFIARWAGDDRYRPSKSNPVHIEVAVVVVGKIYGGYGSSGRYTLIHRGANAVYAAQVGPPHDHGLIAFYLQYANGSTWYSAGEAMFVKMRKRGAGVGLSNLPAGTYRIGAYFDDSDHEPGHARWSYFRITG